MNMLGSFFCLVICALLLAGFPTPSLAATITVNTLDDELNSDGDCSLREAVQSANTASSVDACVAGSAIGNEIWFSSGLNGEIPISSMISITRGVAIQGSGRITLRRSGSNVHNMLLIYMVQPSDGVTLSGLTMIDGDGADTASPGSAVLLSRAGIVQLSRMVFKNNKRSAIASYPGILPNQQLEFVRVVDCLFENNRGGNLPEGEFGGGAINLQLDMEQGITIINSVFRNNGHGNSGHGGAVHLANLPGIHVEDSLFIDNTAGIRRGGALYVHGNISGYGMRVLKSTFVGNRAGGGGGDIYILDAVNPVQIFNSTFHDTNNAIVLNDSMADIQLSTFFGNGSSAGFIRTIDDATALLTRNALFDSPARPLCTSQGGGTAISQGNNRFQQSDASCGWLATDQGIVDPRLMPLGDYGGRVPVMLPRIDSPLIDVTNAPCTQGAITTDTDARNLPRPVSSTGSGTPRCDIGAVEWNPDHDLIFSDDIFADGFEE
jgi:CSLREA domain-containing protein